MNYKFIQAKYYSQGWIQQPKLIVIHWTAGGFQSAINTFKNGTRKASAHFVINTDGEVIQMVDLGCRAWHAGESFTEKFGKSANNYSIGIELVGPPSIIKLKEWDSRQIISCAEVCRYIKEKVLTIESITDHSTISPGRKIDVKKGTGKKEDVFPWLKLLELSGIKEL